MKKTMSLVFVLLFLALCLLPSVGLLLTGGSGAAANQVLAAKPVFVRADGSVNPDGLTELAGYVNDRFSLRQEAVTLWAGLNAGLLHSSVTDKVVLGRDGWLYFQPTLADYSRTAPLSERELWCAARRLYLLQEYAQAQGGQFLFTVAPNKNTLYADQMPALPRNDSPSNTERLYEQLAAMGVSHLDLAAVFRAQDELLYFPRDSHWTSRGAALAADAILSALGRESGFFAAPFRAGEHRGDLYEMLYPLGRETDSDLVYAPGFTFSADSANPDSIRIAAQCETGEGTLLMYRDSFGRSLYPYLAESFRESSFSRKNDYDPTALPPGGTLVIELVERNLRYLLDYAPTLPAPLRDAALAENAVSGGTLRFTLAKGGPEGYTVLRGDLGSLVPDEDSPLYLESPQGLFEALPGAQSFSLCLPEAAAQGALRLIVRVEGRLLALDLKA